jgi:23S rRNA (guanine745-N1)-methyltransferase
MLVCPVRNCRRSLLREERKLVCAQGHSFDIARSGYINLLQPQDRKSKNPGDTAAGVAARQRLHDRGVTAGLLEALAEASAPSTGDAILDAGCGDGFYLGNLARRAGVGQTGLDAHGVDISVPAIRAAAKRFPPTVDSPGCPRFTPGFMWIVANADRFIPYRDASFSLVLSITARMNAAEFRRVLRSDGRLLVAVPAPQDLIELRGANAAGEEEEESGRDRAPRTLETFAKEFRLADQRRVTVTADLDAEAVRDVLVSIYRPLRSRPIEAMRLTFSLDLLLFRPV